MKTFRQILIATSLFIICISNSALATLSVKNETDHSILLFSENDPTHIENIPVGESRPWESDTQNLVACFRINEERIYYSNPVSVNDGYPNLVVHGECAETCWRTMLMKICQCSNGNLHLAHALTPIESQSRTLPAKETR